MDETWVLIDPRTGLHVRWYFWLRVLDEVNRSTRYGDPFGLLILEAATSRRAGEKLLDEAASAVPATIRSTDLGGRLGPGHVGVLLTHQDEASARQARDRILLRLAHDTPSGVTWRSELYSYPEHAAEISKLLTTGGSEREGAPAARTA
ncbi:MAG TPA: GGDEF domain-containing protein [Dehalococcoidia bacterium]|nr:GGDEF domain-containing protein [Dehalococcoidia bacterium]